jgi:porin
VVVEGGASGSSSRRVRRATCDGLRGAAIITAAVAAILAGTAQAQSLLERNTLTGNWKGVRPTLEAYGFKPYLTYTAMLWANLGGGVKRGVEPDGYLDFGVDVDFAKLGAWKGLGGHIDFHWWQGEEPTEKLIGGLLAMALDEWEAASTFRVYNIYLRQSLDDDRWVFKVGQIAADSDFMLSQYAGVFLNATFGDLPSQNLNLDAPVYPLAAPGVFASGRPLSWLIGRLGAYTGQPGSDVAGNHGFDWKLGNNAGYVLFAELGFTLPKSMRAGTYTLGGIYSTNSPPQFGDLTQASEHYELYGFFDQPLLVDAAGATRLGLFSHIGGTPQTQNTVVDIYFDAGLALFAPFRSRPNDVVGLAFAVTHFADDFRDEVNNSTGAGERILELTYQVAVTPWLVVQPDFQCAFNPPVSRRDAQSLGIQAVALF